MLKYEGEAKGVMLNPFKFTNNGVTYFGQWNVELVLCRMDSPTGRD